MALDVKEIHGYEPAYGLRIFTAEDDREGKRKSPRTNAEIRIELPTESTNSRAKRTVS